MNSLLASLPYHELQRLAPRLINRPLKAREILHKNGDPIRNVFFPGRCLCSIVQKMESGGMVEVATVGHEGLVGIGAVLGDNFATGEAFIQVEGEPAQVLPIEIFREEVDRHGAFHDAVLRYAQAFVGTVMQSVACNARHSAEERCCRWLLMTHDRIGADEFPLTHEFLATMLGVRRPTVTLVMAELHREGIVSHVRGRMRITDRRGLERSSCECYRQVRALFQRLRTPEAEGTTLGTFQSRGGDLPAPTLERMNDVSRAKA